MNAVRMRDDAGQVQTDQALLALSAFMDGEDDLPDSLERTPGLARDWDTYHMIGDVLRSEALARPVSARFSARMAQALAEEPAIVAPRRAARGSRHVLRYAVPGAALAAAVAVVTWAVQPYIAPTNATLQAAAGSRSGAVISASAPIAPQLLDYLDAHRHVAGMGGMGTQVSLDVSP